MLIPQENEKDLADIPDNVKSALKIIPVSTFDEAAAVALAGTFTPIEWREEDEPATGPADPTESESWTPKWSPSDSPRPVASDPDNLMTH